MKNKNLLKFIISLSLIAAISINSFASVVYSPGVVGSNEGPGTGLNVIPSTSAMQNIQVQGDTIGSAPKSAITPTVPSSTITAPVSQSTTITSNTSNNDSTITASFFSEAKVSSTAPQISAPAYILVNATNGHIYAQKDSDKKYDPAGLINLMTAYLSTNTYPLDYLFNVHNSAVRGVDKDAAIAALNDGDVISHKDALASMFVKGCVDSANVVAENVSGSVDEFVKKMNDTATSLGLKNTSFANPSGINNNNQLSTPLEMAVVMSNVCKNPQLVELLKLSSYKLPAAKKREALVLYSKNSQIIPSSSAYNADITCSRMGYNSKAGYCVASMMTYQGCNLIVILFKAAGSQFTDTKKLLEFGKLACVEDLYDK